jgi:hypothetical protein
MLSIRTCISAGESRGGIIEKKVKWIQKEQCSYAELTGTQKLLWVR